MSKPVVGQRLFSLNIGNYARNKTQSLTPVLVVSVGRKYFKCVPEGSGSTSWNSTEYHLGTWREKTDYSATSCLYESAQAWEDEKESSAIANEIREAFRYASPTLPLASLRQIQSILHQHP